MKLFQKTMGLFLLLAILILAGCGKDADDDGNANSNSVEQNQTQNQNQQNQNQQNQNQNQQNQNQNQQNQNQNQQNQNQEDPGPPETAAELRQFFVDGFCDAIWECADETAIGAEAAREIAGRYPSLEDCKSDIAPFDSPSLDHFLPLIDDGRISINFDLADECLSDIKANLCTFGSSEPPASCMQIFEGQVEDDEPCLYNEECAGDSFCNYSHDDEDACYGFCTENEDNGVDPTLCGEEHCNDTEFCQSSWDADAGKTIFQCVERGELGEGCFASSQCADGFVCSKDIFECVEPEFIEEGEACTNGWSATPCEFGSHCRPTEVGSIPSEYPGECAPIGDVGNNCATDVDCRFDLRCADVEFNENGQLEDLGTCQPFAEIEEPCSVTWDCAGEMTCHPVDNVCILPLPGGESCIEAYECASNACVFNSETETSFCAPVVDHSCYLPEDE